MKKMSPQEFLKFHLEFDTRGKVIDEKQGASGTVAGKGNNLQKIAYKTIRVDKLNNELAPKSRFFEIAWKVAKYYFGYMLSVQLFKR